MLNEKVTITNDLLYKLPKLNKFIEKVESKWIDDNLYVILEIFGLKDNCYKDKYYYNLYLLMVIMLKQIFGSDLFKTEQFMIKNEKMYMYSINKEELDEHTYLIELLDTNKLNIKKYDLSLLNFSEEDEYSGNYGLMEYE